MPSSCAVAICKLNFDHGKILGQKIAYYRFPKDENLRKIWITKCRRADQFNPDTSRICSLHFTEDSFERDLKAELLNQTPRLLLKSIAIPTIRLVNFSQPAPSERALRQEARQRSSETSRHINNMLKLSPEPASPEAIRMSNNDITLFTTAQTQTDNEFVKDLDVQVLKLKSQNINLKMQLHDAQKKLKQSRRRIKNLSTQINQLRKAKREKLSTIHKENIAFKKILTQSQVALITKKRKIAHWKEEDITRAFTLRYLSKRAYLYIRNYLKYPLPGTYKILYIFM